MSARRSSTSVATRGAECLAGLSALGSRPPASTSSKNSAWPSERVLASASLRTPLNPQYWHYQVRCRASHIWHGVGTTVVGIVAVGASSLDYTVVYIPKVIDLAALQTPHWLCAEPFPEDRDVNPRRWLLEERGGMVDYRAGGRLALALVLPRRYLL